MPRAEVSSPEGFVRADTEIAINFTADPLAYASHTKTLPQCWYDLQRPTRHLNHLRSLRGRNLVVPEGCLSSTSYDFELSGSQTTKEEGTTEHHQQKLYVSEQVTQAALKLQKHQLLLLLKQKLLSAAAGTRHLQPRLGSCVLA